MKKPLVILTGPTASGKTKLSIALAKKIGGEIISADSMQVYKGMDIGSAKIKKEEMEHIPHHLVDILEPDEPFHVVLFQQLAKKAMEEIYERGHIPMIVGGTGFYIQSILYDIDFTQSNENQVCRARLLNIAKEQGNEFLHELLKAVDEEAAAQIHANNVKRVIRALEFYETTGKKISEHNEEQRQKNSPYEAAYFVLTDDREQLYQKIDARVDGMVKEGLIAEVSALKEKGYHKDMVSMQGLGYKEILSYLAGETDLETAIYILKRDTRHFAKRQLTWFKRESDVVWMDKRAYNHDESLILEGMLAVLRERNIIS